MAKRVKSYRFIWPKIDKGIVSAVLKQLNKAISIYDGGGIFADFETKFAKYHNRKYAILCNSGTSAIHSMFVAAGFWVLLDLIGVFSPSNVANVAHIAGLAFGVAAGMIMREQEPKEEKSKSTVRDDEFNKWEDEWMCY